MRFFMMSSLCIAGFMPAIQRAGYLELSRKPIEASSILRASPEHFVSPAVEEVSANSGRRAFHLAILLAPPPSSPPVPVRKPRARHERQLPYTAKTVGFRLRLGRGVAIRLRSARNKSPLPSRPQPAEHGSESPTSSCEQRATNTSGAPFVNTSKRSCRSAS